MSIPVQCGVCGAKIKAPDDLAGKAAPCPRCNELLRVPERNESAPPVPKDDSPQVAQQNTASPRSRDRDTAQMIVIALFVFFVIASVSGKLAWGLILGSSSIFGTLGWYLAAQCGRSLTEGALLGALFGPFGAIIVALLRRDRRS